MKELTGLSIHDLFSSLVDELLLVAHDFVLELGDQLLHFRPCLALFLFLVRDHRLVHGRFIVVAGLLFVGLVQLDLLKVLLLGVIGHLWHDLKHKVAEVPLEAHRLLEAPHRHA